MEFLSLDYVLTTLLQNWMIVAWIFLAFLIHHHYTSTFGHFREMGIPFMKPTIIFGNILPRVFLRTSFHEFHIDIYKYFKGLPYGGYFEGRRPLLLVKDPELIKTIMIKDFDYFTDRNTFVTKPPLSIEKMLINIKGKEWKNVRAILTPTFSSGKLRGMENLLQQCGQQMNEFLKSRVDNDEAIEMKEFIGRYTLEVIGSCAFGLDCASLKDPDAMFVQHAAKFMDVPVLKRICFFMLLMLCPAVLRIMPFGMLNDTSLKQLQEVCNNTKSDREKYPEKRRNDFMQLMVDAAQKEIDDNVEDRVMKEEIIQAQAILFLFAGFETSSTLLSFACAALVENQDIQNKLREEILEVADKNGGKCTYDSVSEIPLLEKVLLETLRRYPPVSRVQRVCTKPYKIPGTDVNMKVGDIAVISIAGIMQDPDIYPNPDVFNPERFSPEEKARRPPHLFLPFGMGPRNCIGLRFAMMTAKFAMFYLLKEYKLVACEKTVYPVKYDRRTILLKAKDGLWLKAEPLSF